MTVISAPIPVESVRPEQVRSALFDSIDLIDSFRSLYCVNPGKDFTRSSPLSFSVILRTILGFGTSTVFGELSDQLGGNQVLPTKNAFIIRRQKVLPEAFLFLFREFMSHFTRFKTKYGYRILAADGSLVSIPDNLKDLNTLVNGKPGTDPYNQMAVEALYDVLSNTYEDFIVEDFNEHSEGGAFLTMAYRLKNPESFILTADRYYGNLNTIAHLSRLGIRFVLRCKDIDSNGFAAGYGLPNEAFDKSFHKTLTYSNKKPEDPSCDFQFVPRKCFALFDDQSPCYTLDFRLVRVMLDNGSYELLVTNLPEDTFPADVIADIYLQRWAIETSFRRLKHLLGTLYFHSYKHNSVLQELYARFIMYNFTALIALAVSIPDSPVKKLKRFVNFACAVSLCRGFFRGTYSPHVLLRLLRRDPCYVRPGRVVPRNHRLDSQPAEDFIWRAV